MPEVDALHLDCGAGVEVFVDARGVDHSGAAPPRVRRMRELRRVDLHPVLDQVDVGVMRQRGGNQAIDVVYGDQIVEGQRGPLTVDREPSSPNTL